MFNNSAWQESEFITNNAFLGTPITSYWKGDDFQLYIYYYDKNFVLQELRGSHASSTWLNGTLGQLRLTTSRESQPPALSVIYTGPCQGVETAWLVQNNGVEDQGIFVKWNGDSDTWTTQSVFNDVKPGTGFSGHSDVGVWRFYYVSNQTTQLEEQVCPDCCSNATSLGFNAGKSHSTPHCLPSFLHTSSPYETHDTRLERLPVLVESVSHGVNFLGVSMRMARGCLS